MVEPVVEARALGRTFGSLVAVHDLTLTVGRGEVFGLLGPNGCGKSTTIRMLCGVLAPTSGGARVVGFDVATDPERVKSHIGYMTQRFSLYEDLTVLENLEFYGAIYGVPATRLAQRIAELLASTGLAERSRQIAGTLSGGWKQRLALACAMVHEPPLIFLDEPTAGVDPVTRRQFWEHIHAIAVQGTTVLVTTHYMDEAERCHRLAFMAQGCILDEGSPEELVERRELSVAEVEVADVEEAAERLRASGAIEELSHLGTVLRITTHQRGAEAVIRQVLGEGELVHGQVRPVRPTVEDAFVHLARGQG